MENNNEKTVFLSSTGNPEAQDSEKTTISNDAAKPESESTQIQKEEKKQEPTKPSPLNKTGNKSDKGISGGAFAAGVAGAAVAGTALGATYSDEIKGVFAGEGFNSPDSLEAEANQAKPENTADTPLAEFASMNQNSEANTMHGSSTFEMSTTDEQGNVYNVTMTDFDGDGKLDIATEEIQLVDGTSISYTATGDQINNSFLQDFNNPPPPQHHTTRNEGDSAPNPEPIETPPTHGINEVEISGTDAEGNFIHVTVTDYNGDGIADVAHESITTPGGTTIAFTQTGDQIDTSLFNSSNYASSEDYQSLSGTSDYAQNPSENISEINEAATYQAPIEDVFGMPNETETPQTVETGENYENIDWASFSDAPAAMESSHYGEQLSETNFDQYQTPESYEDNNIYESGNDITDGGFM